MLGKAEYIKFVLKSICEERIRHFISSKIALLDVNKKPEMSSNPCCKFKNFTYFLKDEDGDFIESGDDLGDYPIIGPVTPDTEQSLITSIIQIYDAAEGLGSGNLAILGKSLTPAERCWICRKINLFLNGEPESLINFISGEGEEYDSFIKDLKCTDFGFQSDSGNKEGQAYTKNSFMDLLNNGKCMIVPSSKKDLLEEIKNTSVIEFIDKYDLYQEFINKIPQEYRSLYRFAAFVSDNIGKMKKDKFDIKKIDKTTILHTDEFIKKSQLKNFEKVPGEWHLQKMFIEQMQILKESL